MRRSIDRLIEGIGKVDNPTVMGLDTRLEYLPEGFAGQTASFAEAAERIYAYNDALLTGLKDIVPAVKLQAAYYEMYGPEGVAVLARTAKRAKALGYVVMIDGKRNDIGATAEAYSAAYLGETRLGETAKRAFEADFLTVNPYLGSDGIKPFLADCERGGAGIFVLVKTSNPSSGELQDLRIGERTVYEVIGDWTAEWGAALMGENGYSAVGAVVGATYPEQGKALRKRLPRTFFLVPGYGAQGASAEDLCGCFDASGGGAVVNASRSLLCAWKKAGTEDFVAAAYDEAVRMRNALRAAVNGR